MNHRLFPVVAIMVVATLALVLQVVIFNGPNTHGLLTLVK